MVTCKICQKEFKKVTNSHLRDKHQTSLEEYLRLFPDSKVTCDETVQAISQASKGKSYEERYGKEKASMLIERRREDAIKQFEDIEQRTVRRKKSWKGYKDISGDLWRTLQEGARKRSYVFEITIEEAWNVYEKQKGVCALSGFPIYLDASLGSLNKRGYQKGTASLDRIDSKRGYTADNIQWVHKDLNKLKSNWPEDYFLEMCKAVAFWKSYKNNK